VFTPGGTVHSLGGDIVVFEVQQNSDITYRLFDWNHVDAKTGKARPLQVEEAIAAIDFEHSTGGVVTPVTVAATPVCRQRLFDCPYFRLWRVRGEAPFTVGAPGSPRVLVCIEGDGMVSAVPIAKGDVVLLPAALGTCTFQPRGEVTVLEIEIPE
jgi:mannose-6-phosphate isomerase